MEAWQGGSGVPCATREKGTNDQARRDKTRKEGGGGFVFFVKMTRQGVGGENVFTHLEGFAVFWLDGKLEECRHSVV